MNLLLEMPVYSHEEVSNMQPVAQVSTEEVEPL